jgi:hypothetical protein
MHFVTFSIASTDLIGLYKIFVGHSGTQLLAIDDRVRIYSVLSLMPESYRSIIRVRYEEQWISKVLFIQVTETLLRARVFEILKYAGSQIRK